MARSSSSLVRRERTVVHTRDEILDAAAATFAVKGYRGTTMQDIAVAAGVTPPTLYSYFEGKAEIFDAIVQTLDSEFAATFEMTLPAGLSLVQKIEILLRVQLELSERRRNAMILLFGSPASLNLPPGQPSGFARWVDRMASWFDRTCTAGEIHGYSPCTAAIVLVSLVHGHVRRWIESGGAGPLQDQAVFLSSFFTGGLESAAANLPGVRH